MGLVFHNGKFMPEDHIQKASEEAEVLRLLRSFLDANEPSLVRFLVNTWNAQGKAITYKQLREAILAGEIDAEILDDWMQDYTRFVTKYMEPAWEKAMAAAAVDMERKYPGWFFDPAGDGVRAWTESHAAEFVTNVTQSQIDGIQAVVRRAAVLEDMSVDQLSRVIRPMVGLTQQQSVANLRYYNSLIENGVSTERAKDLSIRYSARQHRYRGYNIARTELAFAYNQGIYEGTRQAQAEGYLGEVVKVWCTADDERVCPICGGLEGKTVAMDDDFDFYTKLASRNETIRKVPPAHPSCRCGVLIKQVRPPIYQNNKMSNQ